MKFTDTEEKVILNTDSETKAVLEKVVPAESFMVIEVRMSKAHKISSRD